VNAINPESPSLKSGDVDFDTVAQIIRVLEPLDDEGRRHALATVATWFKVPLIGHAGRTGGAVREATHGNSKSMAPEERFSGREEVGPKEFLLEKDPRTEVERLACLAYYLTHFRNAPHFKTVDLSRLNTEAAQRKMSNPTSTAKNAMRDGFLVPAPKAGYRQLSAMGERYVQTLPDRDAAYEVRKKIRPKRSKRNELQTPSVDAFDEESAEG
jgi:hypothetical protein